MNERDKELWEKSQVWESSDDGRGKLKILESVEKFADLIRADAMEAATRAANESWSLACKKMVEFEREACANIARDIGNATEPDDWALDKCDEIETAIRARGNI
jgi:hypothetical protein